MIMPIGIDVFSGAGGLSLGAEMAGIPVVVAIEKDKYAAQTYALNHPNTRVICDDIHRINPLDILPKGVSNQQLILFGGPPCQGFSSSNTKTRNLLNPNNSLFEEFVRFVEVLSPHWFVFENVEGLVHFNGGNTLTSIMECFDKLGYNTKFKILKASDYGVPQNRNRFFLIGNRLGVEYNFPEPISEKITVGDAFQDLPNLGNGEMSESLNYTIPIDEVCPYVKLMREGSDRCTQNYVSRNADYVVERYKYIRQGQNWQAIPIEMMSTYANTLNCHSGIYRRLNSDRPSIVISNYRKNMLIHPYQDRGLSVREAARLQSFPDVYKFCGKLTYVQQQIGNAVPPILAKHVFNSILKYINYDARY